MFITYFHWFNCFNFSFVHFSLLRNTPPCFSVWMLPLFLKKSYAMPSLCHFSDTVLDLLCKYLAFGIFLDLSLVPLLWQPTFFLFFVILQDQRRFCGTQPHFSTGNVPAATASLQGEDRGGGGWRLSLTVPPLPTSTSPSSSFTYASRCFSCTQLKTIRRRNLL